MEGFSAVLIFAGAVLFAMLVFIGYQVYITLVQVRETLTKANRVLDDAGTISDSVVKIPSLLSAFLGQASQGVVDKLLPPRRKK